MIGTTLFAGESNVGQWDNLFAFRDAAMRDDLAAMREVLARDSSFLADEEHRRIT